MFQELKPAIRESPIGIEFSAPSLETSSSSSDRGSQRVLVWLVHGTYGRGFFPGKRWGFLPFKGAIWSEPGSAFQDSLSRELRTRGMEARMVAFNWSGANSVRVRDECARDLALHLDSNVVPGLLQVVIGHSHGGTIALTAAEQYRKTPGEVLVATLATPFIDMVSADRQREPRL